MADLALSVASLLAPSAVSGGGGATALLADPAVAGATPVAEGAIDPFAELMSTLTTVAAALPMTQPVVVSAQPVALTTADLPILLPESGEGEGEPTPEQDGKMPEGDDPLAAAISAGATAVLALNQVLPPAPPPPPAATPVAVAVTAPVTLRAARPLPAGTSRVAPETKPAASDTPEAAPSEPTSEIAAPASDVSVDPAPAEAPATTETPPAVETADSANAPTVTSEPSARLAAFTRLLQRTTGLARPVAPTSDSEVKQPTRAPIPAPAALAQPEKAPPHAQAPSTATPPQGDKAAAEPNSTPQAPAAAAAEPVVVATVAADQPAPPAAEAPHPQPSRQPAAAPAAQIEPNAAAPRPVEAPAAAPLRRSADREPQPMPFAFAQAAPLVPDTAPADAVAAPTLDPGIQQQLTIAQDGQWLDSLARDIAMSANSDSALHFKLNPAHLGTLAVQIMQGSDGASIRLTADNDAARNILVDAQPKLIAEARAQGLKIAESHVDLNQNQSGGSSPRGGEAFAGQMGQQQAGQQSRQPLPDRQPLAVNHVADPEPGERAGDSGELYA